MYFDPTYLVFILLALALSLWASWRTHSAFKKYSRVRTVRGLTGAQAAEEMLRGAGISVVTARQMPGERREPQAGVVQIVPARGFLSDHYNPADRTLALSEATYASNSVAAVGVACHEAGHALQHVEGYKPMWLRSALVPTANIGSSAGYLVMLGGLLFHSANLIYFGALLFSCVLLFQIVTLPVEFDASNRAKRLAVENGIILPQEREGMDKVLNAAAMTYVAAVISTLMTLLYYLLRASSMSRR